MWPPVPRTPAVSGIFYPYLPDLPIARMMFLGGIAVAVLGVLGLPARAGSVRLRRAAAAVTLAGPAAAGTASGLVRTARLTPQGMAIPALHDAANDRPIGYTPVCGDAAGVPVCLNPAYRRYLPTVAADLRPVLAEVAGLPGAPARVTQVAGRYTSVMFEGQSSVAVTISGTPPVLRVPLDTFNTLPSAALGLAGQFGQELPLLSVHEFVGAGNGVGTAAQQAVQAALLQHAGIPFGAQPQALEIFGLPIWAGEELQGLAPGSKPSPSPAGPLYTAARRFAALPAAGLARLAHRPPGRAAGRPDHPESAAMTAAGVQNSPPGAVPAPLTARPSVTSLRLAWLYLLSRRAPAASGLLAGLGALLWAALHWRWNVAGGAAAQALIPLTIESGAAAVIAVTTHGPFGDPERATGGRLPWLRLAAAVGLTAAAFGALAAAAAGGLLPGGSLALLRNLAGMSGTGLLSAAALGGAFGWTGPMAYWLATESVLAAHWTTPWIWPARPPHDRGAAICATLVLAAGIAAVTLLGARDSGRRPAPG